MIVKSSLFKRYDMSREPKKYKPFLLMVCGQGNLALVKMTMQEMEMKRNMNQPFKTMVLEMINQSVDMFERLLAMITIEIDGVG